MLMAGSGLVWSQIPGELSPSAGSFVRTHWLVSTFTKVSPGVLHLQNSSCRSARQVCAHKVPIVFTKSGVFISCRPLLNGCGAVLKPEDDDGVPSVVGGDEDCLLPSTGPTSR